MKTAYRKRALMLGLFCFITLPVKAQTGSFESQGRFKNAITLLCGNYYFPDLHSFEWNVIQPFSEQFGLSYSRRLNSNFSATICYSKWNNFLLPNDRMIRARPATISVSNEMTRGELLRRQLYKSCDASFDYNYVLNKKSQIKIGVGISYTTGVNEYLDSVVRSAVVPDVSFTYTHKETHSYWGVVPVVSYSYFVFKGRINAGANLKARKYWGLRSSSVEVDYGLHIGVNF